jgi:hypothetical protein
MSMRAAAAASLSSSRAANTPSDENDNTTAHPPPPPPIEEELDLLASLGSSVQNTDTYEEDVLRRAELEATPRLTGIGFPNTTNSSQKKAAAPANTNNVATLQAVLHKLRQEQLSQQPHTIKHLLKQQLLLHMLHSTTKEYHHTDHNTNTSDMLGVRPQEELRLEEERRKRFRRQNSSSSNSYKKQKTMEASTTKTAAPTKSLLKNHHHSKEEEDDGDDDNTTPQSAGARLEQIKEGRKGVSFAAGAAMASRQPRRRRRVGIQQRRNNREEDSSLPLPQDVKDLQQRKADLRQLRKEREARRKRRRTQCNLEDEVEEENEFSGAAEGEQEVAIAINNNNNNNETNHVEATNSSLSAAGNNNNDAETINAERASPQPSDSTSTTPPPAVIMASTSVCVECPLCREALEAPNQEMVDEMLSQHVNLCQNSKTRGQRRSSRAKTSVRNYAEEEEADWEEPIIMSSSRSSRSQTTKAVPKKDGADEGEAAFEDLGNDEVDDEALVVDTMDDDDKDPPKRSRTVRSVRPPPVVTNNALDDWDEDDFEDRVDDWIEVGVEQMKVMKEQDANETPPGEQVYDGGLVVPAWINDRLFPYQRTALQWMWELHRQQAGGIVGDEMVRFPGSS